MAVDDAGWCCMDGRETQRLRDEGGLALFVCKLGVAVGILLRAPLAMGVERICKSCGWSCQWRCFWLDGVGGVLMPGTKLVVVGILGN